MRNTSVENAFRWMLAAWLLLATSVASSTVTHDHKGENLSHQHDQFDSMLWHSFVPTALHGSYDGDVSLSATDFHRHGCLTLLETVTYLPTPGEPTVPYGKSPCSWCSWIITVSAVRGVRTSSKGVAVDQSGLASFTCVSIDYIYEAKQRETHCTGIAPASLLCDRARHERSGVQLA